MSFIRKLIAQLIRLVHVNRVRFDQVDGVEVVKKSRTWFGGVLITIGNIAFKFRAVPLNVLHTSQWIEWENSVAAAAIDDAGTDTHNSYDPPNAKTLVMKKLPGETLFRFLDCKDNSFPEKLGAVRLAFQSLLELHQVVVPDPRNTSIKKSVRLSHGDASVQNVIYDSTKRTAVWFDFDLRHDLHCPDSLRHADDLRSLLFTSACFFPNSVPELVQLAVESYPEPKVWNELGKLIGERSLTFDLFHDSQILRSRPTNRTHYVGSAVIHKKIRELLAESTTKVGPLVGD